MGTTRGQINWRSRLDDGTEIDVRAVNFPKQWTLKYRPRGAEDWVYDWKAPREEWEILLDALQRRYQRQQATQADIDEVSRVIARL